jgi:hypothetical protein
MTASERLCAWRTAVRLAYGKYRLGAETVSRRSANGTGVARGERLQSLERGLAVLRAFTPNSPALTISEVADRTGLTRATARRILLTRADLG